MFRRFRNVFFLASQDYGNEWQMSGCFVLALAAVLGPMMILFGLKFGIVGSMIAELVEDPLNREIRVVGSGHYGPEWFEEMDKRLEVAFLVPRTRSIAATIQLKSENAPRILSVELVPTKEGEPLLPASFPIPEGREQVVLSASAAQRLRVSKGDRIDGSLVRRFHGKTERVHMELEVTEVARRSAFARDGAFVSVDLIEAVEDFRDGRAVPALDWQGDPPLEGPRTYPGFRLYARSIYDVSTLGDELTAKGLEVRTEAKDIEIVQAMDRNLSAVFWVIAVIGMFGFSFSLGASLWANVDRKRRELSVLRLVGFGTGDIIWFPVIQSFFTGFLGWVLAALLYVGVSFTINNMFASQINEHQAVCLLLPEHFLIALGITISSAIIAAALAGFRSARVEPSDGLREI